MAEYVGPDGGYFIDGDDLDHVRTVMRWKDAEGVCRIEEKVCSYATFRVWHQRATAIVEEVERRRAQAHILTLPRRRRAR